MRQDLEIENQGFRETDGRKNRKTMIQDLEIERQRDKILRQRDRETGTQGDR